MPHPLYFSVRTPIVPCRSSDDKNLRLRQEIEGNFTSQSSPYISQYIDCSTRILFCKYEK